MNQLYSIVFANKSDKKIVMEFDEKWDKEKENLKLQFEALANKYVLFEDVEKTDLSEKLQKTFADTKEELHNLIKAL